MKEPVPASAWDFKEREKQAEWIADASEFDGMIDRLVAAMKIVERAYGVKLEQPGKNFNHLFQKPGSPATEFVRVIYEELSRNERERKRGSRDER